MTHEEAVALVKTEFETRHDAAHVEIIRTGLTYDGCNGFCVVIYNRDGDVHLSDMGMTKEIFDEVTEEQWRTLCEENGCVFNHWRIEHPLNSLEDVYHYIEFLDMVSDMFFVIED